MSRLHSEFPVASRGHDDALSSMIAGEAQGGPVAGSTQPTALSAVGFVEIAHYQALRRSLGKARAERLVTSIAQVIEALEPRVSTDIAARDRIEMHLSADTFPDLERTAGAIRAAFDQPIEIAGETFHIAIRVAIVAAGHGTVEEIRLIEEAEAALADTSNDTPLIRRLTSDRCVEDGVSLVRQLPAAIAQRQMCLQYQPKVDVRQQKIASAEALIRWEHPTRGLILPGEFITLAENAGAILPLTLWTLEQAIADQARLAQRGHDIEIFVNISGILLADTAFVAQACHKVTNSKARIGFEITETAVIRDPESAIRHLGTFAEHGISIAIDDYGAGLSSLAYLKRLPASELKIDKMFVMQLTSSNRDPLIVRSTIDLAHALDMRVTAEGVETQAALALLSVMGCDMVQGYLLSRPLSFDSFERFLDRGFAELVEGQEQRALRRPASFWKSG